MTFSVDGADQRTYARYRQGGDFARVLKNMTALGREKKRLGREVPFINWRYILFKWNDSVWQMRKARRLAKKAGVDRLTWEITDHPAGGGFEKISGRHSGLEKDLLPRSGIPARSVRRSAAANSLPLLQCVQTRWPPAPASRRGLKSG